MRLKSRHYYKKKKRNARLAKTAALALALFGLFCVVKVWQNVSVDQLNRQNEKYRKRLKDIHSQNALMIFQVEKLNRIDLITSRAKRELGFSQVPKFKLELGTEQGLD
ncbi:MAG: hypothetical protein GXO75_13670 [Calditrichaeota bacterium]|nr:hypothetical protein [Calditrichota bacterium]